MDTTHQDLLVSGFSITILTSCTAVKKFYNLFSVANIGLCLKVQVKNNKKTPYFLSTDKILLGFWFLYIYIVDHIFYLKQNSLILNLQYVFLHVYQGFHYTAKSDITAHLTCFQVLGIWPRYPSMHRFQVLPKDRNTNIENIETMTQCPFTKWIQVIPKLHLLER